jgi:hypothetical protein
MTKTILHNDRLYSFSFEYRGADVYTRTAPMSWLAVVADQIVVTNDSSYLYERIDSAVRPARFVVDAMHKQLPGGGLAVDYWRVLDTATGMRAGGTAKYADPADARRWADGLNA